MKVIVHSTNRPEQPLTSPFPLTDGWFHTVRSGDYYSPDSWDITKVKEFERGYVHNKPFRSYRKGSFGFYVGWKVYGVEGDNQRAMPGINPEDVYPGSVAIQGFTWRFTNKLGPSYD